MQRIIYIALLSFVFTSCFIIEEYETASIEEGNAKVKTRQDLIQDSVIAYFKKQYSEDAEYLPYTFGTVFANKPQEIVELEQLYTLRETLPTMQNHYGSKLDSVISKNESDITAKKAEIREKKIYTTYDLTHLYCVKSKNKTYKVVETKILSYPNNSVKDAELVFATDISENDFKLFEHYIHQDALIYHSDYSYQSQKNASAYKALNQALIDEPGESKGDLLKTILKKVKFYQKNNEFDAELFTSSVLSEWTKNPTLNVKIEKVIKTSKLTPIKKEIKSQNSDIPFEALVGYKKFMLINGKWEKEHREEKAVYCEFDKNHVLKGVLLVEGEHEKYF